MDQEKGNYIAGKNFSRNREQFVMNRGVMQVVDEPDAVKVYNVKASDASGDEENIDNIIMSAKVFVPKNDPDGKHAFTIWATDQDSIDTLRDAVEQGKSLPNLVEVKHSILKKPGTEMHNRVVPRYLLSKNNSARFDNGQRLTNRMKDIPGENGENRQVPYTEAFVRGPIFKASEFKNESTGKDMYRAVVRARGFDIPIFLEKEKVESVPQLKAIFDELKTNPGANLQVCMVADMHFAPSKNPDYGMEPRVSEIKSLYNPFAKLTQKAEETEGQKSGAKEKAETQKASRPSRTPGM